jgi:hypothetical protein
VNDDDEFVEAQLKMPMAAEPKYAISNESDASTLEEEFESSKDTLSKGGTKLDDAASNESDAMTSEEESEL